jgi:hypothetical protein
MVLKTACLTKVLVEWKLADVKPCPTNHSHIIYHMMLKDRIENLARLLKAEFKP